MDFGNMGYEVGGVKKGKRQWNMKNMRKKIFFMGMRVDGVGWEANGVFRDGHEVGRLGGSDGCKDIGVGL